ncbi:hypothetical protein EDEG_02199 [Edhazardia aedis USNM 41457]|uniref:Uncharacterized protein n=1 Tax=Edhazardia aedis (strain USNM 41457) TaxID=1003232 RepID=J9D7D2_EDHAE|nr:hypothetical protein EDEG_02199 [Edhazardia aedis USNM 41457]|eukprot:EJW03434.1 hypothetical protein EDEG_02199 [Edhazardia aedis USNM 41457]
MRLPLILMHSVSFFNTSRTRNNSMFSKNPGIDFMTKYLSNKRAVNYHLLYEYREKCANENANYCSKSLFFIFEDAIKNEITSLNKLTEHIMIVRKEIENKINELFETYDAVFIDKELINSRVKGIFDLIQLIHENFVTDLMKNHEEKKEIIQNTINNFCFFFKNTLIFSAYSDFLNLFKLVNASILNFQSTEKKFVYYSFNYLSILKNLISNELNGIFRTNFYISKTLTDTTIISGKNLYQIFNFSLIDIILIHRPREAEIYEKITNNFQYEVEKNIKTFKKIVLTLLHKSIVGLNQQSQKFLI